MASGRFAGLVIGLIIVSLGLQYSSACADEAGRGRKGKWLAGIASQNLAASENDIVDDFSAAAVANNISGRKGLRGARKMGVDESLERNQGSDEAPKISGIYSSKKTSKGATQDYQFRAQDNSKMPEKPKQKSARMGLPNSTSSVSPQDASKTFLDAADEVVNLIHGDYGRRYRPSLKPPIHNHKTTD